MVESDNSDTGSVLGRASLHSQHSTTENRDQKRTGRRLRATHSTRATNAKKGIKGRTPMGRSPRWCCPCSGTLRRRGCWSMPTGESRWRNTLIKKGYEDNKIKDAMLFSLEGKAHRNFRHCDEHGDLTPAEILKRMDMSYNASGRLPGAQCPALWP